MNKKMRIRRLRIRAYLKRGFGDKQIMKIMCIENEHVVRAKEDMPMSNWLNHSSRNLIRGPWRV